MGGAVFWRVSHALPSPGCHRAAAVGAVVRRLDDLRPPGRARAGARADRPGLGQRHQLLRQRRGLCQWRGRAGDGRCDRRPAPAARRLLRVEQGVFRRGRGSAPDPARTVAQARGRRLPRGPAAAAGGLPGPVLLPSPRSGHPAGGNGGGHGPAGAPGQGAVLGHVRVARIADPRGGADRPQQPPGRPGGGAAAVQPAAPRAGGAGIRAAVFGTGPGHDHLVAAGLGPAHRQVHRWHPPRGAAGLARRRLAAAAGGGQQ